MPDAVLGCEASVIKASSLKPSLMVTTQTSSGGLDLACRDIVWLALLALALLFRCELNASLPVVGLV